MLVVPPMVNTSTPLPPAETVSEIPSVTLFDHKMLAAVMSLPELKLMLGTAFVLNSNPTGAFKANVPPPMPPLSLPASVITIAPKLVQAGETALAAVSAEIPLPPLAAVTVTLSVNIACAVEPEIKPVAVNSSVMPASSSVTYQVVVKLPFSSALVVHGSCSAPVSDKS